MKLMALASHGVLACLLAVFAIAGVATFPEYQVQLGVSLLFYSVALYYFPFLWLYVLLVITVSVNLAPWTGRYIVDELDFFIATTLAVQLYKFRGNLHFQDRILWPLLFVLFCFLRSYSNEWFEALSPLIKNFYLSELNGLVIFKGILWAFLLTIIFRYQKQAEPTNANIHLICAGILSSLLMFILLLWEKGALSHIFSSSNVYDKANAILNLSSAYRTTGVISGMHTGGESVDGIYMILLPITLVGALYFRQFALKIFALFGVVAVMYGVVMGFTRATYAAAFVVIVAIGLLYLLSRMRKCETQDSIVKKSVTPLVIVVFIYGTYFLSIFKLHGLVGFFAELSSAILISSLLLIFLLFKDKRIIKFILILAPYMVFAAINLDSYQDSQWVEKTNENYWTVICYIVLAILSATTIAIVGFAKHYIDDAKSIIIHSLVISLVCIGLASVLAGTRINMRMETSTTDLNTRLQHWHEIVQSSSWNVSELLIGNGIGSMPTNYALSGAGQVDRIGNFKLVENGLMLYPGTDLMVGQRIETSNVGMYLLSIEYSSTADVTVAASLCRRNLIVFEYWAGGCGNTQRHTLKPTLNGTYLMALKSSTKPDFSLPSIMTFRATSGNGNLVVKSLSLVDAYGKETLNNSQFESGMDHWFFYYDFEHLAWHVKNIYLSIFYQLGALGFILFAFLMFTALRDVHVRSGLTSVEGALVSGIFVGQLTLGLFSDPMDSARTNMWFYFVLFGALLPFLAKKRIP